MPYSKHLFFFLLLLTCCNGNAVSQPLKISRYYTVADGLPSNHVYKCLQDGKGFLWIATENGLSRFDGQNFTNFTVKDGLPDNDILDIFLDSTGNLWMIPFGKYPAYFDTKINRIINKDLLPDLARIKGATILLGHAISNGDVVFYDNSGKVFIIGTNGLKIGYELQLKNFSYFTKKADVELAISSKQFSCFKDGRLAKTTPSPLQYLAWRRVAEEDNKLLFFTDAGIVQLSNFDKNLSPHIAIKKLPFGIANVAYLKNYIGIAAKDGSVYFLDKETLDIKDKIETDANIKNISQDRDGNLWIATDDKGIIKVGNPLISSWFVAPAMSRDILSLVIDSLGFITGNIAGQISVSDNNRLKTSRILPERPLLNDVYVKKIIKTKNGIYLISDKGIFLKNGTSYSRIGKFGAYKDALLAGDSVLLLGNSSRLEEYNLNTKIYSELVKHRVSALTLDAAGDIYFGSNDGLYIWKNGKSEYLGNTHAAFTNSITKLCCTQDNIIWIGLSSDTLMAVRNDSLLLKISLSNISQSSVCKSLASNKAGQIWVGTDQSLIKINYQSNNGKIAFTGTAFTKDDGLSEGQINAIAFYRDTVYVATAAGLSKFNVDAVPTTRDIPVYITKIMVNNKRLDVLENLDLSSAENNIQIIFSGVELNGFHPLFQYKINNSEWQNIDDNSISLSGLSPGTYLVQIRALKRNNDASAFIATLKIKINIPFWQNPYFLLTAAFLLILLILFFINKRKHDLQKRKFKEQSALDQQRLKITADLHDDIGASLSSLQINSAVANQLINEKPQQAKKVLEKIEEQSKRLSENIGDIIWSMKPGKDEFMTMSSRIKTFITDILSSTNINYTINIAKEADTEIQDFSTRKNVVLIIKEAINNAVKYSGASQIDVTLQIKNKTAVICIKDNGKGIQANHHEGNGLANMKKRTEELNGNLEIKSQEGKGSEINCFIPLI